MLTGSDIFEVLFLSQACNFCTYVWLYTDICRKKTPIRRKESKQQGILCKEYGIKMFLNIVAILFSVTCIDRIFFTLYFLGNFYFPKQKKKKLMR